MIVYNIAYNLTYGLDSMVNKHQNISPAHKKD